MCYAVPAVRCADDVRAPAGRSCDLNRRLVALAGTRPRPGARRAATCSTHEAGPAAETGIRAVDPSGSGSPICGSSPVAGPDLRVMAATQGNGPPPRRPRKPGARTAVSCSRSIPTPSPKSSDPAVLSDEFT